ncbi:hypothetical protein AGMMS49959_00380 [Planctomycetales bacterium]|nr:hypothetical protein AGMMS49959_00380 [Planctomycetales bacterium]
MATGAMTVVTNLNALNTQISLSKSNQMLSKSLEKLSSGYRINTAADDPSGLIISEQLRTQVAGLTRASQNSQEACNVIGIAEGALIEVNAILTKMRSLAIHAANNGVTAPDQVAADQSEVDSGIQTIERIASTTRFSDQYLLNGSKGIVFDSTTTVDTSMNHALINVDGTRIDQVFKRVGTSLTLSFSGVNDGTTMTQAQWDMQARRAYVEADKSQNALTQIDDGKITAGQIFVVTGTQGSRQFTFAKGTELGTVYQSINNVKDSIGVGATLIFNNDVTGVNITTEGGTNFNAELTITSGAKVGIYNLGGDFMPKPVAGGVEGYEFKSGVYGVDFSTSGVNMPQENTLVPGVNLDGEGRMYLKWVSPINYIAFKDADMTMEVGRGTSGKPMGATNNSGVEKAQLIIYASGDQRLTDGGTANPDLFAAANTFPAPVADDISMLQFAQHIELNEDYQQGKNALELDQLQAVVDALGLVAGIKNDKTGDLTPPEMTAGCASNLSGINLGVNTDENGKLYYKYIIGEDSDATTTDGQTLTVEVYRDANMNDEDLVARGIATYNVNDTSGGAAELLNVPIFAMPMDDNQGKPSGIYGNLVFNLNNQPESLRTAQLGAEFSGSTRFNEIGLRLYTQEYGSQEYLRLQNIEGQMFGTYKNPASPVEKLELLPVGNTSQLYGSDATIYVNGQAVKTQGLTANITTPNYSGKLVFNQGAPGLTTVAQVGQDVGGLYSRGGSLQAVKATDNNSIYDPTDPAYLTWVTNARHTTTETIGHFVGGMQYQLGEGAGDQERTIYAIPSMTMTNLGKMSANGVRYSLQDVLSGGVASLANDPVRAMAIVTQAVTDVTELRARLGAFQSNMLQTNINSLDVTVENIQKTESSIRDADMARESTEFTKNQILVQAGTTMLAQANQINQNVLSLLGG